MEKVMVIYINEVVVTVVKLWKCTQLENKECSSALEEDQKKWILRRLAFISKKLITLNKG